MASLQFAEPQPGDDFGPYSHLTPFAQGGMAELWLARHAGHGGLEKLVVLKRVLPGHAADPEFHDMFLREARIAASLDHPNVARVYDSGVSPDGRSFLAMEYVHGVDLRTLIRAHQRTPLELGHALTLATALCTALDYVHARCDLHGQHLGLIHRDISPGNVLLSFDGAIKLTDFGVAGAGTASLATTSGTVKGKLAYMAPEQARGQALDQRADIYALGVVLYEMTVGMRPFGRTQDVALLYRLLEDTPPAPGERRAGYPEELERIVLRALHKDPEQRYPTAGAMLRDLEEFAVSQGLVLSASRLGQYAATRCGRSEPPSLAQPTQRHGPSTALAEGDPAGAQLQPETQGLEKIQSVITRHQPVATRGRWLRGVGGAVAVGSVAAIAAFALWPGRTAPEQGDPKPEAAELAAVPSEPSEPADLADVAGATSPSVNAPDPSAPAPTVLDPAPAVVDAASSEVPVQIDPEAPTSRPRRKRKRHKSTKTRQTKTRQTKTRALDNPLPFGGS